MKRQKLLFFDIDGTLVGFDGVIPDSTRYALKMAQENGHRIFLCTGRTRHQIYGSLLDYGFDGIVGAAGSYVEYRGEILNHKVFGRERMESVLNAFKDSGTGLILETKDKCISTDSSEKQFFKVFKSTSDISDMKELAAFSKLIIDNSLALHPERYQDTQSILYCNSPYRIKELRSRLPVDLHVEQASFKEPDSYSGEITIASASKETGIREILKFLGKDREDVIAFGDGANDIPMLDFADTAVAMGNASERVRKCADYVTDPVNADGIYNAMKQLRII